MKSWDCDSIVAVQAVGGYRSFYSTRWRKGFPSFQFQAKSSMNLTVIRLLEDIESQTESRKEITFWSKGQESQSSTALNFVFWISMLAQVFLHRQWHNMITVGFLEERTWSSATWWEISPLKDLEESFNFLHYKAVEPLCVVWSSGPLQVLPPKKKCEMLLLSVSERVDRISQRGEWI